MNYIRNRIKSFGFAFSGIGMLIAKTPNARIHLLAAILAISAAVYFPLNLVQWCLIIAAISAVLSAEAINSAIETLCDHLHPQQASAIKLVKDLAAGSVLLISIGAMIIGLIIFIPHLINIYQQYA